MATSESQNTWQERASFIMAVCAVLISAASFYATYLQAESSEKQVKAMTLPLLEFIHGNWDQNNNAPRLQLQIRNAGAGPAILHKAEFIYRDKTYDSVAALMQDCCSESRKAFLQKPESGESSYIVTAPLNNAILPGMQTLSFYEVVSQDTDHSFWQTVNKTRFDITAKLCYCSLLEDCYESRGITKVVAVEQCKN